MAWEVLVKAGRLVDDAHPLLSKLAEEEEEKKEERDEGLNEVDDLISQFVE